MLRLRIKDSVEIAMPIMLRTTPMEAILKEPFFFASEPKIIPGTAHIAVYIE